LNDCEVDYISVSYLILSVIDCGYCTGYSYQYNNTCLQKCPLGTVLKNANCIPIDCVQGYSQNNLGQCVPSCDKNQEYLDGRCQCIYGYNMIDSICQMCP
jgi:hypothetical protein